MPAVTQAPYATSFLEECWGGDECCQEDHRCGRGEGDCDSNDDCAEVRENAYQYEPLICGKDNCVGAGFDSTDDCCEGMASGKIFTIGANLQMLQIKHKHTTV